MTYVGYLIFLAIAWVAYFIFNIIVSMKFKNPLYSDLFIAIAAFAAIVASTLLIKIVFIATNSVYLIMAMCWVSGFIFAMGFWNFVLPAIRSLVRDYKSLS